MVPENTDGFKSLDLKIDLDTLKVNMSVKANEQFFKENQVSYVINRIEEGTKCNYMNTLSTDIE